MIRYALLRMVHGAVTLGIVSVFAFVLTHLLGDPVNQLLPIEHTHDQYLALRHQLGYDRPLLVQYKDFAYGALTGNLGESTIYGRPALSVVLSRLPVTAALAGGALLVSFLVGVPTGVLAGYRPNGIIDKFSVTLATIGQAVPAFVIAIVLILVFAVNLHLLPSGGWGPPQMAILPIGSLSLWTMSGLIRLARSGMREVMTQPFIVLARAKGLSDRMVLLRHALRPSLLPVITFGGLQLGVLLTGAVVTESVFAIPGVGRLVVDSVEQRDHSVILAAILVGAFGFVLINLVTDLSYSVLDPRIRYRHER